MSAEIVYRPEHGVQIVPPARDGVDWEMVYAGRGPLTIKLDVYRLLQLRDALVERFGTVGREGRP